LFFIAAVIALFLALTEIFEFVELPFESLVGHLFTSGSLVSVGFLTSLMVTLGYGGLFILMFLESASLPIPSEIVLPFAGYLVFMGTMNFEAAVLVGAAAGVSGALVDYYVALKLGRPAVQEFFKWFGVRTEHLDDAERWLDTKGSWSVLVARFIPGLRSAISLPAGALRMRLRTFTTMTAIGAFGWSALLIYIGYSAGSLWNAQLAQSGSLLTEIALFAVALACTAYIVYFVSLIATRNRATAT
jgi:membrane protein DedA with SNARE-associated domain